MPPTTHPKLLPVLTDPDPFLRRVSEKVSNPADPEIRELISDMVLTMREEKGIGLAAIQVGVAKSILVIETKDGAIPFVNPEIINLSDDREVAEEGCLSLPGQFGFVDRSRTVAVRYLDENGEEQELLAEGLFARVIQHEVDHLHGILFTDKQKQNPNDD